ncbi:unnamed protein product [marine sediment metagenome]|uniref:Uncharacterized protein n=1 Tax=marine sediment metagenome TaxID=412755 RepID=X1VYC7_9ZZZZ
MTTIITTPSGEEIRIDGTKVCRGSSPEKCWQEDPEIITAIIQSARRKGWKIERSESLAEILRKKEKAHGAI